MIDVNDLIDQCKSKSKRDYLQVACILSSLDSHPGDKIKNVANLTADSFDFLYKKNITVDYLLENSKLEYKKNETGIIGLIGNSIETRMLLKKQKGTNGKDWKYKLYEQNYYANTNGGYRIKNPDSGDYAARFAVWFYYVTDGKYIIKFVLNNKKGYDYEIREVDNPDNPPYNQNNQTAAEELYKDIMNKRGETPSKMPVVKVAYIDPKKQDDNPDAPNIENHEDSVPDSLSQSGNNNGTTPPNPVGRNIIFYGAPGTGKSYTVDQIVTKGASQGNISNDFKNDPDLKDLGKGKYFRTTFHPDTDYASFVGCYKPHMNNSQIEYKFVSQAFLKAYCYAWNHPKEQTYLVIEEINRGNCAQIFGDIFQLLDRIDDGTSQYYSKYGILPDEDIIEQLSQEQLSQEQLSQGKLSKGKLSKEKSPEGQSDDDIKIIIDIVKYKGKCKTIREDQSGNANTNDDFELRLPHNLTILATMNTSDQSLFLMDSAFKRRWEWKYVKINYENSYGLWNPVIGPWKKGTTWTDLLKALNVFIKEHTKNTNKLMGEFFIKPKDGKTITYQEFRDKVLFYLFNDVFKNNRTFKISVDKNDKVIEYFEDLFEKDDAQEIVEYWLKQFFPKQHVEDDNKDEKTENEKTADEIESSAEKNDGKDTMTDEAKAENPAEGEKMPTEEANGEPKL